MDSSFLEQLASGLVNASKRPNVLSYSPNSPEHEAFHKSIKIGRILRGGNRAGKSVAGVVESIWRATGKHPYQKTHDPPVNGRIVTVDKDNGIEQIIKPLLRQWVPSSELVNGSWDDSWKTRGATLTFRNGSTIEVMTHQQDVEAFAGVPRHFVWYDEECPSAIFNECRLRLIDFNGCWFMTMTPVEGQDWIFERFIVTANKNVDMFEIDISSNPHLNQAALKLLSEDLTEEEKEVREKGIFVPRGGYILTHFDLKRHVIPASEVIPDSWSIYVSIDHGFNTPSAILWHAVSPKGKVVTFKEIYKAKWLISQHVSRIKQINLEIGREPLLYIGDPSMIQKNGLNGSSALAEYRRLGIPVMQGTRDVKGRNNKMNEYLKYDMWVITEECPNTVRENKGYSFMTFTSPKIADRNNKREEPKKKNDHCPDSCGYFFGLMPYLTPEVKNAAKKYSLTITNNEDFPWEVDSSFYKADTDEYGFGEVG